MSDKKKITQGQGCARTEWQIDRLVKAIRRGNCHEMWRETETKNERRKKRQRERRVMRSESNNSKCDRVRERERER